jgi:hypothetical protein
MQQEQVVQDKEYKVLLEDLVQQLEVLVDGVANTGGASGGSGNGSGGSGIVVVRAPGSANLGVAPGTNTVTTLPAPAGGCKVATFTVSGTLTT